MLPALKSRWTTLQKLLEVRDGKIWCIRQSQCVTRVCTRPPCCRVLSHKVNDYLAQQGLPPSGINIEKEKFPDRPWLILAVATLSKGTDEIFGRDYVPPMEHLRKNAPQQLYVHNNDGLLDVPAALMDKHHKRSIRMVTLSKEDKIAAQLALLEERAKRHAQKEEELRKELERQKAKQAMRAKGLNDEDFYLEEAKKQVFNTLKQQAQEYID